MSGWSVRRSGGAGLFVNPPWQVGSPGDGQILICPSPGP
ncbi:hypothetical protein F750_7140 (plasmid) [Streptomyces sp. PAMC 26508]|nr:hypothetical protein F750_7140 [Streptomyces sp. PAMC 26508]